MDCPCSIRRWVRGNLLGAGSFGTVHLALNAETGELFAVKSIDCSSGRSEIAAMENERCLLQSLNSPFVIRCFGGDETCEKGVRMQNLFVEHMSGGSLADLMRKFGGALDEGLIRVYTRGILEGLEYLHGRGVVHCDIKGKNVLIGGTGIKIADFGSAKRMEQQIQAMRGTPLWMAPEVIMQEEQGTPSDIWSLGCTVVEMATGRAPWSHLRMTPLTALTYIGSAQALPPLPDCLSPDAKDFLTKCLHRDPRQRWTAAMLLKHPFVKKPSVDQGPGFCKLHGEVAALPPLSPTSVLDVGSAGVDGTSSWEENRGSVPLLRCPKVGRLGEETSVADGRRMSAEEGSSPGSATSDELKGGGWITVRGDTERQRPMSSFMLAASAAEAGVGAAAAAANASPPFLRVRGRPPLTPQVATWRPQGLPHQQSPPR